MDLKLMIEREANQFADYAMWENPSDFNDKLSLKLYEYDGNQDKLIFLYKVHNIRTEYLTNHKKRCNSVNCREDAEVTKELYFVEKEIKELNPSYKFTVLRQDVNIDLIKKNLVDLNKYPDAGKMYQSSMDKLNEGTFQRKRNLIDDLRLSIELLLRDILKNDKSLENQVTELGIYLKSMDVSVEIRNMFLKLIEYYCKYQNEYVKHDDSIKENEIDFIINVSSSFIRLLLQVNNRNS
jgi:hypothetical protein